MDRNGNQWTGDEVDADARGEGAASGSGGNRDGGGTEDGSARQRSIDTAAEASVRLSGDDEAPATTAGGGAASDSDCGHDGRCDETAARPDRRRRPDEDEPDRRTRGGQRQAKVEDRPNVRTTTPEAYPDKAKGSDL
jgi:hypothetical protein